jgi:hypothetical protein
MRQTAKYREACSTLTFPHQTQEQLYQELNRLVFFWNSKTQKWERNDQLADPPSNVVRIRVWAATEKIDQAADAVVESMQQYGLRLVEKSEPYICRPPKQNDSRIYLTFIDEEPTG